MGTPFPPLLDVPTHPSTASVAAACKGLTDRTLWNPRTSDEFARRVHGGV